MVSFGAELENLKKRLQQDIPITAAMGLELVSYDGHTLHLAAPLTLNHNDKGTAFAGSISTTATLAGWALLMLWSQQHVGECQVAVSQAEIRYRKPILTDFYARAYVPEDLPTLEDVLRHKGRVKAKLRVEVYDEQGLAVEQVAEYAIWRCR